MNNIGIAIIDVYEQENLNLCFESIKNKVENIIVVSNTGNKLPDIESKRFTSPVQFATLRNWAIYNFRNKGLKHFFIINSNTIIKDFSVFENTIKKADNFGIWSFLGPSENKMTIEDDEKGLNLNLSEQINSDFIYICNDLVSKVGFFDERYFNTKNLDVLDYILRLRSDKLFTPTGFIPSIQENIETMMGNIKKANHCELGKDADQSVNLSYAYFLTKHQYIPTQNDPQPVSKDELMKCLEELQQNYSNKL
jgi:hypothetical protein